MTKKVHFLLLSLAFLVAMPAFDMQKTRKQKKREKKFRQDVKRNNAKHQQQIVSELSDAHKKITTTKNELQYAQQELTETRNALEFEKTASAKLKEENESFTQIQPTRELHLLNRQWFLQQQKITQLETQL